MKIQKHLLAVIAVAGLGYAGLASAMDFSVYGSLRGGINQVDNDDVTTVSGYVTNDDGNIEVGSSTSAFNSTTGGTDITVARNAGAAATFTETVEEGKDAQLEFGHGFAGSRIGIRGSEDLGNGAEAGLHWESAVGGKGDLAENGRHANVWYSGAFGKITIGQQGNPYRNAANWDQSWWLGGVNRPNGNFGGDGGSRLQGIRYDGGSGAFNFSVMAHAASNAGYTGSDSNIAAASSFSITANGGTSTCTTAAANVVSGGSDQCASSAMVEYAEVESETGVDSWIATGHYDMGVATINLGYRVDNNEAQQVGQSWDNFVISANGVLDALSWYVAFESNSDNANVKGTRSLIANDASTTTAVDAGNVTANDAVEAIADTYTELHDNTTIGLFLGYSLSDVSTLYLEWENTANDGLDVLGENLDQSATLLGFSRKIGPSTSFIAEYSSVDRNSELAQDYTQLQGYLKVDF